MDQVEDIQQELQSTKGENCIVIKLKEGLKETRVILTNKVWWGNRGYGRS